MVVHPPVYCRSFAYDAFRTALPEVERTQGLLQAAVAIAMHDRPEEDVIRIESTIADIAATVRRRVHSTSPLALLAHLHDVLFDVICFRGDEQGYYDPRNSFLPDVLRRRRGIPITLVLVYKCVAEELGLTVHGINAPGHFLAGVELHGAASGNRLMYVDPFYGGVLLNEDEVFERIRATTGRPVRNPSHALARATHRQWLARMLHNLQAVFASTGRERDLLAMQELHDLLIRYSIYRSPDS